MAQKQRQVRTEQRGAMAQMQALESRSDEELERERVMKAPAYAILGARAAERYDAATAREWFRKAVAAARPQERMQIRRMADASLALAERRPDDLRAAVERLGQEAPSKRQLLLLRFMGIIAPPKTAPASQKVKAMATVLGILVALLVLGFLVVKLIALPFGGAGTGSSILLGILLIILVLVALTIVGRRRQAKALAARSAGPGAAPPAIGRGLLRRGKAPAEPAPEPPGPNRRDRRASGKK